MRNNQAKTKPAVVMLASTFPRWDKDSVPSFVLDFALSIQSHLPSITVIAPHYPKAKLRETLASGIKVKRFRYVFPYRFENIAYGQFNKSTFYPLKVALYTASEFWVTLATCLRRRPVVINAHWIIPQGFVAVLVAPIVRARVVISVHGADVYTLNGKYMRKVKRFVLQRADAVVVNSSATQEECQKLWEGREYPVIPMGIDVEMFKPAAKPAVKSGKYTVLFVGRLASVKGVNYLCEAINQLHAKYPEMCLRIVGDGPERPNIGAYISENGLADVISLEGWVQRQEIASYYHDADVFAGPSAEDKDGRKEALGLVFAEASAAGLPVIATDAGGMKDIVKNEETGFIVPQKDVNALRDALEYLYLHRDEGVLMGQRGSAFVRKNFSWEDIARRYAQLLDV